MTTAHDFTLPGLRGGTIDLGAHGGPVLVANTASLCGFTPHYAGLQRLHEAYAGRGLLVVAVPSNDFGGQEPGEADSIGATCDARGVRFPVAAKAAVRGAGATPLFAWLAREAGPLGRPRWNFYKYLIGQDGRFLQWFSSLTPPDSPRLHRAIERSLA